MMRAMWVFRSVRIGMMHSVKDCVGSWRKVRAPLPHPREEEKELFPILAHHKHLVGGVSVQEEALAKQREIPVEKEEYNYNH